MKKLLKYLPIAFLLGLQACNNDTSINLSDIHINQEYKRFEQDLFNIPLDSIWDYVPIMEEKYPTFFDLYNTQIINIGSTSNFSYAKKLSLFITDPDIYSTFLLTQKLFTPLVFKEELTNGFKRYNYHFPETPIPNIYTHISGFNQSIIIDSTYLSISLDKYLGGNSKYYQMLRTPKYLKDNMHPQKISSDVMLAFTMVEHPNNGIQQNLINEMVYYGKIYYTLKELLPNTNDTLIWGISEEKLNWSKKNESFMWMYLIEHKQLFSSNYKDIIRYIEDGPFTAPFSKKSPSKTGRWIGYQIVKAYMKNNKDITLQMLFEENDHQKILNESKYKP